MTGHGDGQQRTCVTWSQRQSRGGQRDSAWDTLLQLTRDSKSHLEARIPISGGGISDGGAHPPYADNRTTAPSRITLLREETRNAWVL